jgi:hypothetical protein
MYYQQVQTCQLTEPCMVSSRSSTLTGILHDTSRQQLACGHLQQHHMFSQCQGPAGNLHAAMLLVKALL